MQPSVGVIFLKWFYWDAPRQILQMARDYLSWAWQMFSIGFFLPRIFSPWHRDVTGYGRGFDLARWTQAAVSNAVSRLAGAVLRIFFIVTGLIIEALILAVSAAAFFAWLLLPIIALYLFLSGVARI